MRRTGLLSVLILLLISSGCSLGDPDEFPLDGCFTDDGFQPLGLTFESSVIEIGIDLENLVGNRMEVDSFEHVGHAKFRTLCESVTYIWDTDTTFGIDTLSFFRFRNDDEAQDAFDLFFEAENDSGELPFDLVGDNMAQHGPSDAGPGFRVGVVGSECLLGLARSSDIAYWEVLDQLADQLADKACS